MYQKKVLRVPEDINGTATLRQAIVKNRDKIEETMTKRIKKVICKTKMLQKK